MPNVSSLKNWPLLEASAAELKSASIASQFEQDSDRFSRYTLETAGLFLDYSKNQLDDEVMTRLHDLAGERNLVDHIKAMFAGEPINATEGRAVLHTALRSQADDLVVDGINVMPAVHEVLARMKQFVQQVRGGGWQGVTGKPVTDVVNIGIGGSDLGPKMVAEALVVPQLDSQPGGLKVHFVSNVDGEQLLATLAGLNAETTLFVITSKTFTTAETLTNARSARRWFVDQTGDEQGVDKHFVAVSCNAAAVTDFGIAEVNRFEFWDWVGGRYSLWSAVGLSIALACGMDAFEALLAGAEQMDEHFRTAPLAENMPVILALVGIWNRNFLDIPSLMVMPYDQRLASFPAYLQQCDMESNGKSVTLGGQPVGVKTAPVIWGAPGTNGQHAYMQLLHQGNEPVASDFIVALQPRQNSPFAEHHPLLVANCFAQAEALMGGRTADEAAATLVAAGYAPMDAQALAVHQALPGSHPSNMLLMDRLTPATLGALIALYEHKIFVQGVIWGINSFDQWGVELGKQLAKTLITDLDPAQTPALHDGSTQGLVNRFRAVQAR